MSDYKKRLSQALRELEAQIGEADDSQDIDSVMRMLASSYKVRIDDLKRLRKRIVSKIDRIGANTVGQTIPNVRFSKKAEREFKRLLEDGDEFLRSQSEGFLVLRKGRRRRKTAKRRD